MGKFPLNPVFSLSPNVGSPDSYRDWGQSRQKKPTVGSLADRWVY